MEEMGIKEGMIFRNLMSNGELRKTWIFNYKGNEVRGVNIEGVKIWFPKKYRAAKEELKRKLLGRMQLKCMEGEEYQFFLIPDLTFIKNGILFQEIFERPEFEIKYIKDTETFVVKGVKIGNVKIWLPKTYRGVENEFDLVALKSMKLKKDLELENKYFLIPPPPEVIPDNIVIEGQTLEHFLEDKDFNYIFNSYHGTISGVKVQNIPIYFPKANQVSESELELDALGAMRIKRSTIMEVGYFLEP
ncbi:MAG: hypothetical protein ABJ092_14255 [Gillisia sp.]